MEFWHSKSYFDICIRAVYRILTFKILFWHSNLDRISNFDIRNPILTFEFGPNIEFWHSKSYFDIRTRTEYRILTFKIQLWHSNSGRISNFDILNTILTFEFGPNIEFWHSKSYFDIQIRAEFRILSLKILFWHSNSDRISIFDIQNPILTFELGPNIEFWHSKSYFDIRIRAKYWIITFKILIWHSNSDRISNFDIRNPIFTFEFRPNIEFWHSKSYFYIRIQAEYRILTFKILFLHSNSGRISNFNIQNLILTFELGPNIEFFFFRFSFFDIRIRAEYRILTFEILFWHSNSGQISNFDIQYLILTFELGPNIEFWHSKSYFDTRIRAKYWILTFKILFWNSNLDRISNFDIQNPILTFAFGPYIEFGHSKSYFDIRTWTEYRILTFEILFWHSNSGQISNFDIQNLILTFELRPNIEFWHSKSYFDIQIRAEYRILTFKILFWHSNLDRISNFDIQNPILTFKFGPNFEFVIQNPILTFEFGPNIDFWHSKSYFEIRTWTEYRILTFKILFWHSNLDQISNFDIQNLILTFEFGPNIEFWHSKSYFDIQIRAEFRILSFKILFWHSNSDRISNFDIQNPILTFELGPNIEFWHSKSCFDIQTWTEYRILTFKILFWHSNLDRISNFSFFVFRSSFLDIRIRAEYRFLTFEILFWHSNSGKISNFDIQNLILTFELGPNIEFWSSKSYLTFKFGPNIEFWHSKSYFDIRIRAKYRISTFKILFWHSNLDRISNFDIRNPILTFEFGPNIEFCHSKSYFDIRTWTEYWILTFEFLFWQSNSGRISNFDIQNLFLTFELGPNIEFWHSKSYFDIRIRAKYRIITFKILFWHSNSDRISNFDIRNPIFTFEFRPNIEFWHSKSYFYIQIQAEYRILTFKILFLYSNSGRISNFDIQNLILTFELGPNIECWHSKSFFNIWIRAEYRILTFKILFWHSNLDRISNFGIRNPILTFEFGPNIEFWHSKYYWHSNSDRISNFDIQNPILTFKFGPNFEFCHSKSYFDIRIRTEYRILTFKILFWHSNLDRISNFDIQNLILTFELGPNIEFWHSKSYFDIRTWTEYRIFCFSLFVFRHSNSGRISLFDILNPILTFEFGQNIEIWHSKSYFDIRTWTEYRILTFEILFWHSNSGRISNFDILSPNLTFEFGPNIEFWHSEYRILTFEILFWHSNSGQISNFDIQNLILTFELGPNIEFWNSNSYFDNRIRAEYRILTFKILFWHSNLDRISNFDFQNPILTFEFGQNIDFWHSNSDRISNFDIRNPIFTFEFRPNIEFWHSKNYFEIRIRAEYRILKFKILFWHSNLDRISNFDIKNPILTFEFGPNFEFWHSKSYFDIRTCTEYQILTFEMLIWHSLSGQISNFDIQNLIFTFERGPNIELWHSKSYFYIRIKVEYRILTFEVLFLHSNSGRISNFDIQNPIFTFEFGPNIEFWHSKSYFDIRTWTEYRILTFKILF